MHTKLYFEIYKIYLSIIIAKISSNKKSFFPETGGKMYTSCEVKYLTFYLLYLFFHN